MKKVLIFGDRDFALMADAYFAYQDTVLVVGFCVEREYLTSRKINNKPIYPFDDVKKFAKDTLLFAPIADSKVRERIYNEGKRMGFKFHTYVSPKATNYSKEIGENCFIQEDNTIQFFTSIGNNVVLWAGNHIGHHSVIEDCVTVTSHVVISGHCTIKKHASLGVNCAVRDGVTIEEGCTIGMSASVIKNTEKGKIYIGVPAKIFEK